MRPSIRREGNGWVTRNDGAFLGGHPAHADAMQLADRIVTSKHRRRALDELARAKAALERMENNR